MKFWNGHKRIKWLGKLMIKFAEAYVYIFAVTGTEYRPLFTDGLLSNIHSFAEVTLLSELYNVHCGAPGRYRPQVSLPSMYNARFYCS